MSDGVTIRLEATSAPHDEADAALTARRGEVRVGGCSLWWSRTPESRSRRTGFVGHLDAPDAEIGSALLRAAARELGARGARLAIGPIDGSTWRRYRAVTESSDEPAFAMEPTNPEWWPNAFRAAGYAIGETYHSSLEDPLVVSDGDLARLAARESSLREAGITIGPIDPARADETVDTMYALSIAGFADNVLYAELPRMAFAAMYRPLVARVPRELALVARDGDGEAVGFMFAAPNVVERSPVTLVLKSIATLPRVRGVGLGAALLERCRQNGARMGFRRAIYALMHDANRSADLARRRARVIRRYALFEREAQA